MIVQHVQPRRTGGTVTRISYNLNLNSDGTLTIKVGRQVEVIELLYKERGQIFEDVKWRLVSKDAFVNDQVLTSDLYEVVWRHT